jgi:hypothetical protein
VGVKIICFSATASFAAGFVLLAIGTVTVCRASTTSELPYAAIPILFAVQQLIEGALWLALPAQSPSSHMLTICYLLFSNILWPIYVPLAVWIIEPRTVRRKRLLIPVIVGTMVSLFFVVAIVSHPVAAEIMKSHMHYLFPHSHHKIIFAFYAAAACLAPLLSSHKMVRLFGVVLIASMIAAYFVYQIWFASVWCFFAALLSSVVFLHFLRRETVTVALSSLRSA